MSNIRRGLAPLIGGTPLVELAAYSRAAGLSARILAKLELMNPAGSIKDRAALAMVEDAERRGLLSPGSVIVEPTSGNTGIGLAAVASARGYRLVLTMPETMSAERRALLAAYGAELVLTDGAAGMAGSIAEAERLVRETPGAYMPGQFTNPVNAEAHYRSTGPELWEDAGGAIDVFVATVGTGGTITGTGRYLKEQNPKIHIAAVEPADSPVLSGGKPGPHAIQGIGAGFVPDVLDTSVYDEVVAVASEDAEAACRRLAASEGILCGISSGAALAAAGMIALRPECGGKTVAVILPDSGERYLSTGLFERP